MNQFNIMGKSWFFITLFIFIIILTIKFLPENTTLNSNKTTSPLQKMMDSSCLNQYTDKENQFSFCLPVNYYKSSENTKLGYVTASFGPLGKSSCPDNGTSYCYVYYFHYTIGNTETPPQRSEEATISSIKQAFQTDAGEIMKQFYPFSPSIGIDIYSYKLKNGKYVYFDFVSGHPKVKLTELSNHLKILKSVKQI